MKKPDAVTVIHEDKFREEIWQLPASDMLGVGRQTAKLLQNYGITTIGGLAECRPEWIKFVLGKNGLLIWNYANGRDFSRVMQKDFAMPVKSIGHGITAAYDISNSEQIFAVILELTQDIGRRLRIQKKAALSISVSVRDSKLNVKQWQTNLPIAAQSPTIIARAACELFKKSYKWDYPVRSVTVTAINLTEQNALIQTDLFSDIFRFEKIEKADSCIEKIRRRFGDGIIKNAVLLQNPCSSAEHSSYL